VKPYDKANSRARLGKVTNPNKPIIVRLSKKLIYFTSEDTREYHIYELSHDDGMLIRHTSHGSINKFSHEVNDSLYNVNSFDGVMNSGFET